MDGRKEEQKNSRSVTLTHQTFLFFHFSHLIGKGCSFSVQNSKKTELEVTEPVNKLTYLLLIHEQFVSKWPFLKTHSFFGNESRVKNGSSKSHSLSQTVQPSILTLE